jgi:hypothetical protein
MASTPHAQEASPSLSASTSQVPNRKRDSFVLLPTILGLILVQLAALKHAYVRFARSLSRSACSPNTPSSRSRV